MAVLTAMRFALARALRATSAPTLAMGREVALLPEGRGGAVVMAVSWNWCPSLSNGSAKGLGAVFQGTWVSGKYCLLMVGYQSDVWGQSASDRRVRRD